MSFYSYDQVLLLSLPLLSNLFGLALTYGKSSKTLPFVLTFLRAVEFFGAFALLLYVFLDQSFEYTFLTTTFFSKFNIAFGFRADELSTLVLTMITGLSLCIFNYSSRFLEGENTFKFFRDYQLTLFFVMLLVISNNLIFFFIAWLGISFGLHKLLLFYDNRPKAIIAAKKKWVVSRIGDVSLFLGILLTIILYKTVNFSELIAISHNAIMMNAIRDQRNFSFIGLFIVLGALSKSAQFPLHFWLPETMETPTPVSALMHAGIINAGGYLILRFSPVLVHATFAHVILVVIGGITAVFGALIMGTQNNVKKQLAYSTISQLGYMMIECGIGVYSLALLHMIAHGFYKAYAFLSTPNVLSNDYSPPLKISKSFIFISSLLPLAIFIYVALFSNENIFFGKMTYIFILCFSFIHIVGFRNDFYSALKNNRIYSVFFFVSNISLYFLVEKFFSTKFGMIMPAFVDSKIVYLSFFLFLSSLFFFSYYLSAKMQDRESTSSKKIWMFFWNGCYFSQISSKVLKL